MSKLRLIAIYLLFCSATAVSFGQNLLYAASGTFGVPGVLYVLDPVTGAVVKTIGKLNDASGNNYGLTGLRYHPKKGVLFGLTLNDSPTDPNYLVKVNTGNGRVTPVGPLGVQLTDLAIDPTTNLMYGVSATNQKFYRINVNTGKTAVIGSTGIGYQNGGGLASDSLGNIYGVNFFDTYSYNKATGAATLIGGTGLGDYVRALAFDSIDTLYGLEGGGGTDDQHLRELVVIDTVTGVAVEVGSTVEDLDALAFAPPKK